MANIFYRIPLLSVKSILAYAKEIGDGVYSFSLSRQETESVILNNGENKLPDSAMYYQAMCALSGNKFSQPTTDTVISELSDVLICLDFSGIFDRDPKFAQAALRQKKAESMFRPEGITLDLGKGQRKYLAFERSASMSRNARLSFVREDIYENLRSRLLLGMKIGKCQLSKLYAYVGLYFSAGKRIHVPKLFKYGKIIVVDNPESVVNDVSVITVQDTTGKGNVRKYQRVETVTDVKVTEFDGEGLISPRMAEMINLRYADGQKHTSFQIRLPFIKGMVHTVDFHSLFKEASVTKINDMWGVSHPIEDVDMILTKSQFKGYQWLSENKMSFQSYLYACKKYRHSLYVTGVDRENGGFTDINYQFLSSVSLTSEEFRPSDLPYGWDHSPRDDERNWLTKMTEERYFELCAGEYERFNFLIDQYHHTDKKGRHMIDLLEQNENLMYEPYFAEKLEAEREKILRQYATGHLLVEGTVRYLSADLVELLLYLLKCSETENRENYDKITKELKSAVPEKSDAFLPGARFDSDFAMLRNPHIAKNEEVVFPDRKNISPVREKYFSHLSGITMIGPRSLVAERLGGADYDGDLVKIVTDPVLVHAIKKKNGESKNLPLLKIPSAEPLIADAGDWKARFEVVRGTFSSRVGQISNAALDRSIIAYDENAEAEIKDKCRKETETLSILTGLEIDAAKSGVKPDLSEYLGKGKVKRNRFLSYQSLIEKSDGKRAWYEPTFEERYKEYFAGTDWENITSNLERLPYYAAMLRKHTPKITEEPAPASSLFYFARSPGFENYLYPKHLEYVKKLIGIYEKALARIRAYRFSSPGESKKSDVQRILFLRDEENVYDPDEIYARFTTLPEETVSSLCKAIKEEKWAFMPPDKRKRFLCRFLPEEDFSDFYDLFSDFRAGGYRLLADIVFDIDNHNLAKSKARLHYDTDTPEMTVLMDAYAERADGSDYRKIIAEKCCDILIAKVLPTTAVKCAVALGKRSFLWDVLWEYVQPYDIINE